MVRRGAWWARQDEKDRSRVVDKPVLVGSCWERRSDKRAVRVHSVGGAFGDGLVRCQYLKGSDPDLLLTPTQLRGDFVEVEPWQRADGDPPPDYETYGVCHG